MSYLLELNNQIEFAESRIEEAQKEITSRLEELETLRSRAWFCDSCKKYYPKDSVTSYEKEETHTEIVHVDTGYGDGDEIAEVTRLFIYDSCPFCGCPKRRYDSIYLHEKNRRTRR